MGWAWDEADVVCFSVKTSWNVMVHAQKTDFVFQPNGRVHLNRRGRQFSRLLAAEMCASAVVMLDTPCPRWREGYWPLTPFSSFPFTSPPVRHRVPSHFSWSLLHRHFAGGFDEVGKLSISQTFPPNFVREICPIHSPYKDEASDGMQVP